MATLEELKNELKGMYENRYGAGSVQEIREQKIHDWLYQFIIFYVDDDGVVKANHDCYCYSKDGANWYWYNTKPVPPPKPIVNTFQVKLRETLKKAVIDGKIEYAEILGVDEDLKKARVFIKTANDEGIYIVSVDENGNIIKTKTSFDK